MSVFRDELLKSVPAVRAYAATATRQRPSEADDLVQDTLEKAWRAREQFQPGTSMKAWLFTIMRNSQHNEWRRSRRLVEDPQGGHAASLCSEPTQGWHIEFLDVLDAIKRLDAGSRQALLLVAAGLSYEQVAIACEAPLRTVQSRVRRARQRLANELEPEPKRNPRTDTGPQSSRTALST